MRLLENESRIGMAVHEDLHLAVKRHCVDRQETIRSFTERAWETQLKIDNKRSKSK